MHDCAVGLTLQPGDQGFPKLAADVPAINEQDSSLPPDSKTPIETDPTFVPGAVKKSKIGKH
jgi:hypothetical protein